MARRTRKTVREAADMAREALLLNARRADPSDGRIGDLVLYDLTPAFRGTVAKVAKVFAAHGLDPAATLPCAPDWPVAFGRALEIVGARLRERNFKLINAAAGADGARRVGIVEVSPAGLVTTQDVGTVVCPTSKSGQEPYIEREDPYGFAQDILRAAHDLHEVYTTDDIRVAVVQHIDRYYGLPLRRQPPYIAYWVHAAGAPEIEKLRDAIEALGAGQIEMLTGYAKDENSKRMAVNTVNKGLEGQLNEFKAEVEVYLTKDAGSTRVSKMEDLVAQAQVLRERGSLYKDLLGEAVRSVEGQYKAIETKLLKHLGLVEEAHQEVA